MAIKRIILPVIFLLSATLVRCDELRFLVVGDWGGMPLWPYSTPYETAVSHGMGKVAQALGTQFTVALGDNFYLDGVKNVDDKRFQETFEDVFTAKSLMTPWFFCAGNHDHHGNVSAQIAYSSRSKRWNFPNFYYTKSWKIPGSEKELQLVLLDTVLLCGNTGHDHSLTQPEGPDSFEVSETQWDWLESTFRSSSAHYLIVGGHYPVWSIAEHGPTTCLVDRLRPLLQKYHVTAYISGHDHNLQHLKEPNTSVDYFVIGAGAKLLNDTSHKDNVPKDSSLFFWADYSEMGGFAVVHMAHLKEPNSAVEYFVIGAGDILDNDTRNKDKVPEGSSLFFWADYFKFGGFAVVRASAENMTVELLDSFETSLYKRQLHPRSPVRNL